MDVKTQMELLELKARVEVLKRFVDAETHGGKYDSLYISTINMIMGWAPDKRDEEIERLRKELEYADKIVDELAGVKEHETTIEHSGMSRDTYDKIMKSKEADA